MLLRIKQHCWMHKSGNVPNYLPKATVWLASQRLRHASDHAVDDIQVQDWAGAQRIPGAGYTASGTLQNGCAAAIDT